jgi:hypothetical protein
MSITSEEYVKRAEECERLAGACIAESNREILLYAAARWRTLAEDAGESLRSRAPAESDSSQDAVRAHLERTAHRTLISR